MPGRCHLWKADPAAEPQARFLKKQNKINKNKEGAGPDGDAAHNG